MEATQSVSQLRQAFDSISLEGQETTTFVNEEGGLGTLDVFTDEILQEIFTRLFPSQWLSTMTTSQKWCRLTSGENECKALLERRGLLFGKNENKNSWGDPGNVPSISYKKACRYYASPCPLFPGKKVEETQQLTLFSEEIIQHLDHVGELAKNPKGGRNPGRFSEYSYKKTFEVYGKAAFGKSFWAFVQVEELEGSMDIRLKVEDLLQLATQYPKYRMHRAVERCFFDFSGQVKAGEFFHPDGRAFNSTICQERCETHPGRFTHLRVSGAHAPDGTIVVDCCNTNNGPCGLMLLREWS